MANGREPLADIRRALPIFFPNDHTVRGHSYSALFFRSKFPIFQLKIAINIDHVVRS